MTLEELTDDEVTDLPVEQLALLILERVARTADLQFPNFIVEPDFVERPYAVRSALAEAWNWLERKGLLGPNVGKGPDWRSITRAGRRVIEEGQPALAQLRAAERLDVDLHPSLSLLVRPQFLIGSYETAVLQAFKAVEVRLRELSSSPVKRSGVQMAKDAFGPKGCLRDRDPNVPDAEKEGVMALFWGAFAAFRNPPGHRYVTYDSAAETSEAVMLASLLMRFLDRVAMQQALAGTTGSTSD